VAAVLAAWPLQKLSFALAQRSIEKSAPPPAATIDEPAPGAGVGAEVTVKGTAVHETIRGWLWLLSSAEEEGGPAGRAWRAQLEWERAPLGDGRTYPPLPAGATMVTSADVTIAQPSRMMTDAPLASLGKYSLPPEPRHGNQHATMKSGRR